MLSQIHYAHLGIKIFKLRARDAVFWPNINQDMNDLVSKCETCTDHLSADAKEPMKPFDIPPGPCHTVGSDVFFCENENYLLLVDYCSECPVIRKFSN